MQCSNDMICKMMLVMCLLIAYLLYKTYKLEKIISAEGYGYGINWLTSLMPKKGDNKPQNLKVNDLEIVGNVYGNINCKGAITADKSITTKEELKADRVRTIRGVWFGNVGNHSIQLYDKKDDGDPIYNTVSDGKSTCAAESWLSIPYSNLHIGQCLHVDQDTTTHRVRAGESVYLGKYPDKRRIKANTSANGGGIGIYGKVSYYDANGQKINK